MTSFWLGTRRAAELMAFLYDLRNINHAKVNVQWQESTFLASLAWICMDSGIGFPDNFKWTSIDSNWAMINYEVNQYIMFFMLIKPPRPHVISSLFSVNSNPAYSCAQNEEKADSSICSPCIPHSFWSVSLLCRNRGSSCKIRQETILLSLMTHEVK